MKKIEIKLYRHKYFKDVYLARNYGYCGGNKDTPFYYGTQDVFEAIKNAQRENFLDWHKRIDGLTAKFTDSKEIDIDGYKGTIEKEISSPVSEFEVVFSKRVQTKKGG